MFLRERELYACCSLLVVSLGSMYHRLLELLALILLKFSYLTFLLLQMTNNFFYQMPLIYVNEKLSLLFPYWIKFAGGLHSIYVQSILFVGDGCYFGAGYISCAG